MNKLFLVICFGFLVSCMNTTSKQVNKVVDSTEIVSDSIVMDSVVHDSI